MAQGDCETVFAAAAAAAADGIVLVRTRVSWLNQRGHLGLPARADAARAPLERMFLELGGSLEEQGAKRLTTLPGDFMHAESGTFIEVDESQHFTSFRLRTLELYPPGTPLGFDVDEYRTLCRTWAGRSDRYRAAKPAVAFGEGGRQRQRAYYDALRDLATPAMGYAPVIRVAAPHRDGALAYDRVRDQVRRAVGIR